jgi:recombination protein RecT
MSSNVSKNTLATVQQLLERHKSQIAMALPRHMTPERMIRVALTCIAQNPLLQMCTPVSLCSAIVQASILGLEPNSELGECYLIPYWNSRINGYECQLQVGYKGHVKLARNSGEIAMIDAQPVYSEDEFEFVKGDTPTLRHKWPKSGMRGELLGYWAGFRTKDGAFNFEYWSLEQIYDHRDRYSQSAFVKKKGEFVRDEAGNRVLQGAWKDNPDWMCRKTVLIQVLKLAPKSVQLSTAIALDEKAEAGLPQEFIDVPFSLQPPPAAQEDFEAPKRKSETQKELLAEQQQA